MTNGQDLLVSLIYTYNLSDRDTLLSKTKEKKPELKLKTKKATFLILQDFTFLKVVLFSLISATFIPDKRKSSFHFYHAWTQEGNENE